MNFVVVLSALLAMAAAQCPSAPQLPGGVFTVLTQFQTCDQLAASPQAGTYCLTYHDGADGCPCQCGRVRNNNNQPLTTAPPPTAPTSAVTPTGPFGAAGSSSAGCFHSSATVLTESGRVTMIELLKMKNVKVQTINDKNEYEFSPVEWWIHADPHEETNFYTLATESGHKLQLSDRHMIYVTPCDEPGKRTPKFAKNVELGECVFVQNPEGQLIPSSILSVEENLMTGVYSPITATGSIIVDGVAASVFSTFENEYIQKMVFSYLMAAKNFLPNWLTGLEMSTDIIQCPEIILAYLEVSKYVFA